MPPDALGSTCAEVATVDLEGNTSQSRVEGTQDVSLEEAQQPWEHGTGWTEIRIVFNGDEPLSIGTILSKWEARSIGQDLSASTKVQYRRFFERYSAFAKLESRERKWFASKATHDSIVEWVMSLPEKSRRIALAALESVWTYGIDVPFPVNKKRDFGRRALPQSDERDCPTDADIEPIYKAADHEDDPYLKSFVLVGLSTGLRPGNQLMQLTWADIREHDGNLAIVAVSKPERRFKSDSPVIARLPDAASDALKAWREQTPCGAPSDYVWPVRQFGRQTNRKGGRGTSEREFLVFLKRHNVKTWVRLAHVRHWLEYRGERDGVPAVLLAFMRGHAVKTATEGKLGYGGNRKTDVVLDDQQARWPNGPCGVFEAPMVIQSGIPPEVARLVADFMARKVDATTFALRIADARAKSETVMP